MFGDELVDDMRRFRQIWERSSHPAARAGDHDDPVHRFLRRSTHRLVLRQELVPLDR
jgi:hypothetical protein